MDISIGVWCVGWGLVGYLFVADLGEPLLMLLLLLLLRGRGRCCWGPHGLNLARSGAQAGCTSRPVGLGDATTNKNAAAAYHQQQKRGGLGRLCLSCWWLYGIDWSERWQDD